MIKTQESYWENVEELDTITWPEKRSPVILSLNAFYHDSSAALFKDGYVMAASQEERFTRKKHDNGFPFNAINYCLSMSGTSYDDIDLVVLSEQPLSRLEREISSLEKFGTLTDELVTTTMRNWKGKTPEDIEDILRECGYPGEIAYINHHLCHIASSYFPSGFHESALIAIDGVGEELSTLIGIGTGNEFKFESCISFPHSVGLLYSTITALLGFRANNGEYKVMGLAPWSLTTRKTNPYYEKMKQLVIQQEDGSYQLNMKYFAYEYDDKMFSKDLEALLEITPRKPDTEIEEKHKHIAGALQMLTEDLVLQILNHLYTVPHSKNVCLSGGVGLNSVLNGKILQNTPFERMYIHPASGDDGTVVGGALYAANKLNPGFNRDKRVRTHIYMGPEFSDNEVQSYLTERGITYKKFNGQRELIEKTAQLLYENKVVGWFQGRMEWGPRALGARSILANPSNPEAQALLNLKVKHREEFRPFAPVVCDDDASEYFDCDTPMPATTDYMLMVYPIKKQWHEKIPAVTHVDGSGRLQTIKKNHNPLYYELIKEFGRLSSIPILINTSFNIRGEPIVCTPHDAYMCMMGTEIDCLVMEDFLIFRQENPQDIWDAEQLFSTLKLPR